MNKKEAAMTALFFMFVVAFAAILFVGIKTSTENQREEYEREQRMHFSNSLSTVFSAAQSYLIDVYLKTGEIDYNVNCEKLLNKGLLSYNIEEKSGSRIEIFVIDNGGAPEVFFTKGGGVVYPPLEKKEEVFYYAQHYYDQLSGTKQPIPEKMTAEEITIEELYKAGALPESLLDEGKITTYVGNNGKRYVKKAEVGGEVYPYERETTTEITD